MSRVDETERVAWEFECVCGYYAMGLCSAGWKGPIPAPPKCCPECDRQLDPRTTRHHVSNGCVNAN